MTIQEYVENNFSVTVKQDGNVKVLFVFHADRNKINHFCKVINNTYEDFLIEKFTSRSFYISSFNKSFNLTFPE